MEIAVSPCSIQSAPQHEEVRSALGGAFAFGNVKSQTVAIFSHTDTDNIANNNNNNNKGGSTNAASIILRRRIEAI